MHRSLNAKKKNREICVAKFYCLVLSYSGAGILSSFPFTEVRLIIRVIAETNIRKYSVHLKPVSDVGLGLTHPRRTKLQHGTFLRFGHPRLNN